MLVNHFLENSADRIPEKIALICGEQRWSYRQINEKADKLAVMLIELGAQRQDRIILFLDNSAEAVISIFAVLKAGSIFIPLNPTMKSHKLKYICNDSQAKAIFTHSSKIRVIQDTLADAESIEYVIWAGRPEMVPPDGRAVRHLLFEEELSPSLPGIKTKQANCIDQDLAAIIYTSGSTGEPKGVMSAHYNVVAAVKSITSYLENREDDVILSALPLSFDYGLYQVLMAFYFGGTVVQEKSFVYPLKILEKIKTEGVTGFPIVPTMIALILQMQDLEKIDFSPLRYVTNTAAALPAAHIRRMQQMLPHVRIFSMYGLTECKRVSYLPPEYLDQKPESVGLPIPNSEVFILNNDGQKVKSGEVGELVIRGTHVMQGYWNTPEETAQVFRPGSTRSDAWLYSGDLFRQDEHGFLYFVARKDDLIKTRGERVSPKEIENILCSMAGVVEAAVIGVPDETFGQAIKVFIVKDSKSEITKNEVLNYCKSNLEPFMVPKYIEFCGAMPKSPSGKIDKKNLALSHTR